MSSTATTSATISVRCKAFSNETSRKYRVQVEADGTVRVWDWVAQHFTTCHSLSTAAIRRISKLARA